nr:hypothetical protein DA06_12615 [Georgenia sp. SUBG003]
MAEHLPPEAGGQPQVDRDVEHAPATREVLVELPCDDVEPVRCEQDPRTHRPGDAVQHGVAVLEGEGDPQQPGPGGGQQELADRRVDRAVGHVQESFLLCPGGEPLLQVPEVLRRDVVQAREHAGRLVPAGG